MKLRRGDIVLATLPFSDFSGAKKRPAVVVQSDRIIRRTDDVILAMVTSNTRRAAAPTQLLLRLETHKGAETGLLHDSVVKCEHLLTLHRRLVPRRIGRLSIELMRELDERLRTSLGL
jgi:mRNA interferase MazF